MKAIVYESIGHPKKADGHNNRTKKYFKLTAEDTRRVKAVACG